MRHENRRVLGNHLNIPSQPSRGDRTTNRSTRGYSESRSPFRFRAQRDAWALLPLHKIERILIVSRGKAGSKSSPCDTKRFSLSWSSLLYCWASRTYRRTHTIDTTGRVKGAGYPRPRPHLICALSSNGQKDGSCSTLCVLFLPRHPPHGRCSPGSHSSTRSCRRASKSWVSDQRDRTVKQRREGGRAGWDAMLGIRQLGRGGVVR